MGFPRLNRAFILDTAVIIAVSVAICLASQHLGFMTVFVPTVIGLRFVLWSQLAAGERRHSLATEAMFFAICMGLGAFNDWNSVVRHHIYDYGVPHYFEFSTIPIWMLIFWGMILRYLAALGESNLFGGPPRDDLRLWGKKSAIAKVIIQFILILTTRQFIYLFYLDAIVSWIPFAIALIALVVLFGLTRSDLRLVVFMMLGGPLIEALYIGVGGLHSYHHGWIMGVPLWIALWWIVGILIWKDLSGRILVFLRSRKAELPIRVHSPHVASSRVGLSDTHTRESP